MADPTHRKRRFGAGASNRQPLFQVLIEQEAFGPCRYAPGEPPALLL